MKTVKFLFICAAFLFAASVSSQPLQRICMDFGGIPEDVQVVYGENPATPQPVVWSACMDNAFFRTTRNAYPDNQVFEPWSEYLPGKAGFGVEAILVQGSTQDVEHVILCSAGQGLFYDSSTNAQFTSWDRPGGAANYPLAWKLACHTDAAFWLPASGSFPADPIAQFYMTGSANGYQPSIYRWYSDAITYIPLDPPPQQGPPNSYRPFQRDVANPNVLYVIKCLGLNSDYQIVRSGRLYKLSGAYGSESLVDIGPAPLTGYFQEILSLSQWKDPVGENIYYYLYTDNILASNQSQHVQKVFVSISPADQQNVPWNWTEVYDPSLITNSGGNQLREWTQIYDGIPIGAAIGRPYWVGSTRYHKLWMTNSRFGVWYLNYPTPPPSSSH
jgi:hypothetical protein